MFCALNSVLQTRNSIIVNGKALQPFDFHYEYTAHAKCIQLYFFAKHVTFLHLRRVIRVCENNKSIQVKTLDAQHLFLAIRHGIYIKDILYQRFGLVPA